MKPTVHPLILLLFSLGAGVAKAGPIVWSISPVTLQGCCISPLNLQSAVLSGTFVFDSQTLTYTDWNFNISAYTDPVAAMNGTLTPATSSLILGGPTFLHLLHASQQADLVLSFGFTTFGGFVETPLPPLGGTVPLAVSDSSRFVSFFANAVSTASSVPEPTAGFLVLVGAAILCIRKPVRFRRSGS